MILSSCRKTPHRAQSSARQLLFLSLLSALLPQISAAYTIIFATPPNATVTPLNSSPVAVDAEAIIDFNQTAHTLTISLLNLTVNACCDGQMVSGIEIDFANLSGSLSSTITSQPTSNDLITLSSNGTPTLSSVNAGWLDNVYDANTLGLCEICATGNAPSHGQHMIIGAPDPTKVSTTDQYTGANNGLKNGNVNGYILGSGGSYTSGTPLANANATPTWVLSAPQVTAGSYILNFRFFFGSAYDLTNQEVNGTLESAPEPGPVAMVIGGLLLIGVGTWKRRRRSASR
jgi:hypothetical protein